MKQHYDYLVIGGGPGGTPTAMALASAGKQVLLVEKGQGLGGTCLFEGCIPSKIFRESARRLREIREASSFGLNIPQGEVQINWQAIQQRKQAILKGRSVGAAQRVEQIPTLDLVIGTASFKDSHHAHVKSGLGEVQSIEFNQAIIATGSKASRPPINGIDHSRVLDSSAILDIDHIPEKLLVIGAGPIGVELGQIFNTFGSEVTLLEAGPHILGPVDQELAEILKQQMIEEGIKIYTDCRISQLMDAEGGISVEYQTDTGESMSKFADAVLLVTGRHPNVENLGLENTHVNHGPHGIEVDAQLKTSEDNIYAVGDVIGQPMFAHWATAQGLALAQNLMGKKVPFPNNKTNSAVIFSDPEIGMVGLTEAQASEAGINYEVARYDFMQDARAQLSSAGMAKGLLKIIYEREGHRVIGVHVLVEGADDLMGEAAVAIKAGLPLELIAGAIHPHPTLTESFNVAARMALSK